MKICFLSTKHPPLDKRVFEKEARALSEAGFTVLHLAPSKEFQHPFQKDGISIIPLKPVTGIRTRLGQLYKTYQKAKQLDADCYHCNEVDSWFLGVLLKIINKKMVIFDVHEHYPSNFSESRFPRFLRPAIEATVRLVFKLFIPFTDRIVLAKQSVSEDFPGTEEKQVLVQNYAPRCFRGAPQNTSKYTEEEFKIVHLGLFSKVRGWPQLLEALELVSRQEISKRIKANIIGEFNDGTEKEFFDKVQASNALIKVQVREWMPYEKAFELLSESQVGVILFQPGPKNHLHSFPHKLFDYMRAGMAVIAPAFAVEVSEIISRENCGLLVDPSSPQSIAEAIIKLLSVDKLCMQLGMNGQKAIRERLNWDEESKKLVAMYNDLANKKKAKILSKPAHEKQVSCAA